MLIRQERQGARRQRLSIGCSCRTCLICNPLFVLALLTKHLQSRCLEWLVLQWVNERVDATVQKHHKYSEVVEGTGEVPRVSQVHHQEVDLVGRPANHKADSHNNQRFHCVVAGSLVMVFFRWCCCHWSFFAFFCFGHFCSQTVHNTCIAKDKEDKWENVLEGDSKYSEGMLHKFRWPS